MSYKNILENTYMYSDECFLYDCKIEYNRAAIFGDSDFDWIHYYFNYGKFRGGSIELEYIHSMVICDVRH